jgi:hypothetical protein
MASAAVAHRHDELGRGIYGGVHSIVGIDFIRRHDC